MMEKFLSCDWGTTSFRLRLVDAATCQVIMEEKNQQGISGVYNSWKQTNATGETRLPFYIAVIHKAISALENRMAVSLGDTPLVISGMSSASIGMMELPYAMLPFAVDGSGLVVHAISTKQANARPIYLISGARSQNDVMRGEETQLIGAVQFPYPSKQLFIFPGTHSKHVRMEHTQAVSIKTYMTGEVFELLAKKSVLTHSIEDGNGFEDPSRKNAFEKGARDGLDGELLHHAFHVRTNDLFHLAGKQENYYYLSGLLIGSELNRFNNNEYDQITLVSNSTMYELYSTAFKIAGINNIRHCDAEEALTRGQLAILQGR